MDIVKLTLDNLESIEPLMERLLHSLPQKEPLFQVMRWLERELQEGNTCGFVGMSLRGPVAFVVVNLGDCTEGLTLDIAYIYTRRAAGGTIMTRLVIEMAKQMGAVYVTGLCTTAEGLEMSLRLGAVPIGASVRLRV